MDFGFAISDFGFRVDNQHAGPYKQNPKCEISNPK
jgi:hypothetical protein